MKRDVPSYRGYRFPPEIISHAVWLYHRFGVSFRDVEDLLTQRGLTVSYGSDPAVVHQVRCGIRSQAHASTGPAGRHLAPGRGLRHHPGTAALSLARRRSRWRCHRYPRPVASRLPGGHTLFSQAIEGPRASARAIGHRQAEQLQGCAPSGHAVRRPHRTDRYENNRAEVSHQPTRQRERQMRRFKSAAHAQRFLSVHGLVLNLFRVGQHLLRSAHHRLLRMRAFAEWDAVTCAC